MSWPPTRGDNLNQTERWSLAGVTGTHSDGGCLYAEITATTLILYKGADLATADKVAEVTGGHGAPPTRTKLALAALNTSGLTGSVYFKYAGTDALLEVWPQLGTDDEIHVLIPDFDRWPKQNGQTTFANQLQKAREKLVQALMTAYPPRPTASSSAGDASNIWVRNDRGDYEVKRLHNVRAFRDFTLWKAIEMIVQQTRPILDETDQFTMIEDAGERAKEEFASVVVLVDADQDLDADREEPRFRIYRG